MKRLYNIAVVHRSPLILQCFARIFGEQLRSSAPNGTEFNVVPFESSEAFFKSCDGNSAVGGFEVIVLAILSAVGVQVEVRELMHQLQERDWNIPVVVFSESDDRREILSAFRHGIRGFVPASMTAEQAVAAVALVLMGGVFLPECLLADTRSSDMEAPGSQGAVVEESLSLAPLTPRQSDVLELLRKGLSNRVIAERLNLREGTVKVHVAEIMRKLHARNRTHAAFLAEQIAGAGAVTLEAPP